MMNTAANRRWNILAKNVVGVEDSKEDQDQEKDEDEDDATDPPKKAAKPSFMSVVTTATAAKKQRQHTWKKASNFAKLITKLKVDKPKTDEFMLQPVQIVLVINGVVNYVIASLCQRHTKPDANRVTGLVCLWYTVEARRRFLFDDRAVTGNGRIKDLFKSEERPEEDFNDIVDVDERRVEVFVSQELVGKMIEHVAFRIFIFGLIIVNSLLIGLQTDEKMSVDYRYLFSIFDQLVLATFICEILLKWYYGFWIFWKVGWNVLDFVIILALLLGPQLSFLSSSRILRILRVLRAFRSLRSISALAGLSMVVQTIVQSVPDMANICLLLCIILIVLGVVGVSLFGMAIPDQFGDLQTAMFSLFICVTQDGWVEIFNKFRTAGGILYVGGGFYFFLSIMVGAFVFANLVVAVVVTNLEMAMKEIKEEKAAEVDTLTTKTEAEKDDFAPIEEMETVNIQNFKDILKHFDFATQTPLQMQDLRGLSTDKLEKFILLLVALEENLVEYLQIRNDLEMIYEVVSRLNIDYVDDDEFEGYGPEDDFEPQAATARAGSNINLRDLHRGDILSNLMRLEEQKNVTSRDKQTISEVVRSARDSVQPREANIVRRRPSRMMSSDDQDED